MTYLLPVPNPLLFVYGTLKYGQGAHELLEGSRQIIHGVSTLGVLVANNSFPMFYPDTICRVYGELYTVTPDVLTKLDLYEGVANGLYTREERDFAGFGTAYIYVYGKARALRDDELVVQYGRWFPGSRLVRYAQNREYYEDMNSLRFREREGTLDSVLAGAGTGGRTPPIAEIREAREAVDIVIPRILGDV